METYNLILEGESDGGVFAISLVENPAVEYNFLYFEKDTINFSISDEEKREVYGVIMLADTPIPRSANPKIGLPNHNIIFSKDTIKEIVIKYSKEKLNDSVTLGHLFKTEGVFLFESYIVDRELGINPPLAFSKISDGSWLGRFKVENDIVWNKIKNGEFKGFSIEGKFRYDNIDYTNFNDYYTEYLKELYSILKKIK